MFNCRDDQGAQVLCIKDCITVVAGGKKYGSTEYFQGNLQSSSGKEEKMKGKKDEKMTPRPKKIRPPNRRVDRPWNSGRSEYRRISPRFSSRGLITTGSIL